MVDELAMCAQRIDVDERVDESAMDPVDVGFRVFMRRAVWWGFGVLVVCCFFGSVSWGLGWWLLGGQGNRGGHGGVGLFVDMIAVGTAQWVFGLVVLGIGCGIARRWKLFALSGVGVAIGLYPIVEGRSFVAGGGEQQDGETGVIRVGSLNISPRNAHWEEAFESMLSMDVDVVIVQEASNGMRQAIRWEGYLDDHEYRYWENRVIVRESVSPGFVISRYPLDRIAMKDGEARGGEFGAHQVWCVMDHPGGDVVVGLVHPHSPRSVEKWAFGNQVLRSHGDVIGGLLSEREERGWGGVIVGADLNATRGQWRWRMMRSFGLEASGPMFGVGDGVLGAFGITGSFPARLPGVARIQIDDVWHSGEFVVRSWELVEAKGSDHFGVVVELAHDK